jgi:hypothetical protein
MRREDSFLRNGLGRRLYKRLSARRVGIRVNAEAGQDQLQEHSVDGEKMRAEKR